MNNLYKILGVDSKANISDIKAAYKKLAQKYHPDKSASGNEEKFKEISSAYEILKNTKKRQIYDDTGSFKRTNSLEQESISMFLQFFNDVFLVERKPNEFCFQKVSFDAVRTKIEREKEPIKQNIKLLATEIKKSEDLIEKIINTSDPLNLITNMLDSNIENFERKKQEQEGYLLVCNLALDHCDKYEYKQETTQETKNPYGLGLFSTFPS